MTTLPPLPLIDGALFVDNSIMDEWNECPRQWQYRFLQRKTSAFAKPALNFGSAVHLALAAIERGQDDWEAQIRAHFDVNPQPESDHRSCEHAVETVKRYVTHHANDPWKPLVVQREGKEEKFVEFPFAYKLFDAPVSAFNEMGNIRHGVIPIFFCGKIDLAIQREGRAWIVDHKTTYQLGDMFRYEMAVSPQMRGYCWAFQKAFGVLPLGYIVDAIRTSTVPDKTSQSRDATNKWWTEQFWRIPQYIGPEDIAEWEQNTIALVRELLFSYSSGYIPMKRKWCVGKYGRCQFYDVCSAPAENRPLILESNLFQNDDWTPLNKPSQT